ncbi:hypothetical protein CR513_51267, partial [Mucuna pruriens]
MVKGSVLNKEMRRKAQGSSSQSEVLVIENRGRSQKKEREKSRSKSKSRYKNVECHYCHKTGHIQKHCFLWKKKNKDKKGKSKEKDDDRVTTVTCDDLIILRDFEFVNFVSDESMWIIDSSATLHVTPRKEFFTSYITSDFGVLKMGNDGVTKVIDVGDVCLQTNTGMQLWLRGVKHAPDVRFNLISVHMLDDGAKKDILPRLKNAELEKCYHCMAGKQTRVSFKKHPPSKEVRGIRHEKTPPKTPQLNGLAKRMNRTLIERVGCMLSEGETFYTAMHAINLNPAVALNTEVPHKIWFGKDVKYDHLRIFGCKALVHVLKDERSKLDMKTRQCIFIGYGHDEYGYKMYDPVEKKLVRSRDVQFMEDQTIEDIDKVKKSTPEKDNSLFEIDPVRMPVHDLDTVDNNVQNGEQHNHGDQQLGDGFDVPLDDDAEEEQEMSQDENLGG